MAKVEIEESEYAEFKKLNHFATTALNNPKTRAKMLGIQKELNPDAVIPELDATVAVMEQVTAVNQKFEALMAKLDERDNKAEETRINNEAANRTRQGQEFLRSAGYNAEGIGKIEAMMLEEGIASYPAAVTYFEKLNPPSAPADNSRTSQFGDMSGNDVRSEDYKSLWESQGDSDSWLNDTISNVRKEFRQ